MGLAHIADLNRPLDEIAPYLAQAQKLSALYDDYVVLAQDGHDRAPGVHASELYPCLRKPVYSLTGVPRKPAVSKFWKQRFKVGKNIHLMFQEDFAAIALRSKRGEAMRVAAAMAEEMNCLLEFEEEVVVSPAHQGLAAHYKLYSACDGVFRFIDRATGQAVLRVGLEIKSEAANGYESLRAPREEHIRQGHVYMAALDLPLMWFLYFNKGNQNNTPSTAPWLITWKPEVWNEVEARLQVVHEFAAAGTLPARSEGVYCEFCPWKYTCQPDNMMKTFQQQKTSRREVIRK